MPSSSTGAGREGQLLDPLGKRFQSRGSHPGPQGHSGSALTQPRAGSEAAGKPWEFVSSLCRKTKLQKPPEQPGGRGSCVLWGRMRREGLLWAGEGSRGSSGPFGATSTCTRAGSRCCPEPFRASPGVSQLCPLPVGDTGTLGRGSAACASPSCPPPPPIWKCLGWAKFHIGWKTAGPGMEGQEP